MENEQDKPAPERKMVARCVNCGVNGNWMSERSCLGLYNDGSSSYRCGSGSESRLCDGTKCHVYRLLSGMLEQEKRQ